MIIHAYLQTSLNLTIGFIRPPEARSVDRAFRSECPMVASIQVPRAEPGDGGAQMCGSKPNLSNDSSIGSKLNPARSSVLVPSSDALCYPLLLVASCS